MNLKRVFAIPVLIIALGQIATVSSHGQTDGKPKSSAQELLNEAVQTASAHNKSVMVHFSASWCGWCKRLDAFLHAPEVDKVMTENYVLLELTVQESRGKKALENPGAEALMREMGGADAGLPFYFFVDKNGKKTGDSLVMPGRKNIGHPANAEEIKAFVGLLARTAPRMSDTQRSMIAEYLTNNARARR